MNRLTKLTATALLVTGLFSCSADIEQYQQTSPTLDIKNYFTGSLTAWGMVQDYSDNVTRRFCVELNGTWQGNNGVLAEVFYFNDGEVTERNWQLTKLDNGEYQGEAEDVIGTASGQQQGFAFQWQYTLSVPVDDDIYHLALDDWMYQIDQHRVFNRTVMKKFGVEVAEITLFFDKEQPLRKCPNVT
ncbi:DUF3833 domain-containing protein [Colwellia sp. D2M02]|uniref:DUF3833 domain-containing protein n=1 Tax=Colwellia asteriadis TaxID=517723 RepID=A0ABN1L4Q8_9GAMM|nr:DUF3833 domain-containing protein [Colwellia sp. D2M02]MBU2891870.1 DUF3833 domain-containing protein [Colwellia sp. D2M02]